MRNKGRREVNTGRQKLQERERITVERHLQKGRGTDQALERNRKRKRSLEQKQILAQQQQLLGQVHQYLLR